MDFWGLPALKKLLETASPPGIVLYVVDKTPTAEELEEVKKVLAPFRGKNDVTLVDADWRAITAAQKKRKILLLYTSNFTFSTQMVNKLNTLNGLVWIVVLRDPLGQQPQLDVKHVAFCDRAVEDKLLAAGGAVHSFGRKCTLEEVMNQYSKDTGLAHEKVIEDIGAAVSWGLIMKDTRKAKHDRSLHPVMWQVIQDRKSAIHLLQFDSEEDKKAKDFYYGDRDRPSTSKARSVSPVPMQRAKPSYDDDDCDARLKFVREIVQKAQLDDDMFASLPAKLQSKVKVEHSVFNKSAGPPKLSTSKDLEVFLPVYEKTRTLGLGNVSLALNGSPTICDEAGAEDLGQYFKAPKINYKPGEATLTQVPDSLRLWVQEKAKCRKDKE